ncbi:MAG: hypothetical protein AVDCRST_MAG66-3207, partial [uncultured Pseudonocardia sp.]
SGARGRCRCRGRPPGSAGGPEPWRRWTGRSRP